MEPRDRDQRVEHGQERPYGFHVFVCTKGPECPLDGPAQAVRNIMKDAVKAAGRAAEIRVNNSGCLGQCGHGPMIATYPDGIWYSHVDEAAAREIVDRHVLGDGTPVERYRFRLGPGGVKALRSAEGKTSCDGHACRR